MRTCDSCSHVHRNDSKNPKAFLCDLFPWRELDSLTGAEQPPFRYCRDVLRLTCPANNEPCVFFEAMPEHGDVVVKERGNTKSVTYREKETAK